MRFSSVLKRLLAIILFWPLMCTTVFGQDAAADSVTSFHLKGVLISPTGRSALVNGKVLREGDSAGGAEILAIEEGEVRILAGSEVMTVNVGGTASLGYSGRVQTASSGRRVKRGDTLSAIAHAYLSEGITIDQMMIAMFEANPRAFGGNINVLREGAVLVVPEVDAVLRHSPATATAKVARQSDAWRKRHNDRIQLADAPESTDYGPIETGETLSHIARHFLRDGMTINQVMMALYDANPHAFSGNINVLHAGAVLRIPGAGEVQRQGPDAATAEVVRHIDAWRGGIRRHASVANAAPVSPPAPHEFDGDHELASSMTHVPHTAIR